MISLADFHFQVTQIKRSAGQSAIASAAYRACEKLYSEYYNETNDYTNKQGLVHSEIMLPDFVPKEFGDREYLWNSVEKNEKRKDAQLAYSFDFALMNEFTIEENINIARRFIYENFVSRGMICDWAFHLPDKGDDGIPNPHIHLMCPIRPMNEDGTWGPKQRNVYQFDENGEVLRDENGRKKYNSVKTTDWSDPETLVAWRRAWADINNEIFKFKGMKTRISAESLEAQGLDLIPTIHEGPAVREMEKRGIVTEKGEFNRRVRRTNALLKIIRDCFGELLEWIKSLKDKPPKEPNILKLITDYYTERGKKSYTQNLKAENLKKFSESVAYLQNKNIRFVADLEAEIKSLQEKYNSGTAKRKEVRDKISELNKMKGRLKTYYTNKAVGEKYESKAFGRDGYYAKHKTEIDKYFGAKKHIPEDLLADENWEKTLDKQIAALTAEVESYNSQIEPIKNDLDALRKIKWCVDVATGAVNPDGEKKERESIEEKLKRNKAKADMINAQRPKKPPTRGELER